MTAAILEAMRRKIGGSQSRLWLWALVVLAMGWCGWLILKNAWVTEDAYITFRTIDNLINGFGARWNVAERVQSYTHPLWMLLLAFLTLFTSELFYTSIFFSFALCLALFVFMAVRVSRSLVATVLVLLILAVSKAFQEYAISGLENPLVHLLLAGFFYYFAKGSSARRDFFWLCLFAALAAFTRLDSALITAPGLVYELFRRRDWRLIGVAALGFAPLIAWELFSLVYYGFPFPNTAYAKLNPGVTKPELIAQGLRYLENSFKVDPITLGAVAVSTVLAFTSARTRRLFPIVLGIWLYLAYVVSVGGDFMTGRFLTIPLVMAALLLTQLERRTFSIAFAVAIPVVIVLGFRLPYSPARPGDSVRAPRMHGIEDERAFYVHCAGLWTTGVKDCPYAKKGQNFPHHQRKVYVTGRHGYFGYYAGPKLHIVDELGLCDPLLARLDPYKRKGRWRVGHYFRKVPPGYLQSLVSGRNQLQDAGLADYYDKLNILTRAPIWSWERFGEIAKFNLRAYDHLLPDQPN